MYPNNRKLMLSIVAHLEGCCMLRSTTNVPAADLRGRLERGALC